MDEKQYVWKTLLLQRFFVILYIVKENLIHAIICVLPSSSPIFIDDLRSGTLDAQFDEDLISDAGIIGGKKNVQKTIRTGKQVET